MSTVNQPMYRWNNVPWRVTERRVFKLQKRIYQASRTREVRVTTARLSRSRVTRKCHARF